MRNTETTNVELLYNPALVDLIIHVGKASEKPANEWLMYRGSVIFLAGKILNYSHVWSTMLYNCL